MNTQSRSLEWFFRTPSAANFPQAFTSTVIARLSADFARFVSAYVAAVAFIPVQNHGLWMEPSEAAWKLKDELEAEFTPEIGLRLITTLSDIDRRIKNFAGNEEAYSKVNIPFRTVLADLVVCAKESGDASFKRRVLELIQQFEQRD